MDVTLVTTWRQVATQQATACNTGVGNPKPCVTITTCTLTELLEQLLQVCFPLPGSARLTTTTEQDTDDHYSGLDLGCTGGLIPQQICVARNPTKHKSTNIVFLDIINHPVFI
jgi:hypothetical protein